MDTWMGNNHDPITLHKYLYANADPGNMVDPTGNFSIGYSLAGIAAAGVLVAVATPDYSSFFTGTSRTDDPFGSTSGSNRNWSLWDVLAASLFKAKATATSTAAESTRRSPQRHHTIPIYLCGAESQQLSSLEQPDHVAVHAGLAAVEVALHAAEEAADIRVPFTRRRSPEVLSLAETEQGRAVIASAIQLYYSGAGWMSKGTPTIGSVFPQEKAAYIRGKTSLPNCKRR